MKAPDYFYDGQMLPFNGRSFDGVINTQVLEHAPNARSMLLEMNRVIKLGGVGNFISVAMLWQEHEEPYDFARFTSFVLLSC
jgi:ubiquinone/menaquinone biosynthesis C-methylase UbiE